ncbi:SDR family oxidoreductase [Nakamurella flavida]|uniref:SDR family oxidoreductase n=1 Tax=Nakamurella flavida TaxID=363630 RepID=A0A938YLE3_9ACTN|nr:SDR family oxidoreductase [Nakamurella flavida]MBM9478147.1 SDR family oxidoreductase [Nakamurella flavida]MDP9778631.1 short-subunit dehydrogenase [Nakamurella flavida]
MRDLDFAGGVAVVTGAAGGIGAALATRLAASGCSLALIDRDADALSARVDELRTRFPRVEITGHTADLADIDAIPALARTVLAAHPRVTLLINNAGIALGGTFDQVSAEDVDAVLTVNLHAVIAMTRAFLPALRASPGSHLVNLSSLFGLVAPAGQVAYATSKFAVRGFSEAMRAELAPLGIGVTVVHPGGIATNIATHARVGAGLDEAGWRDGLAGMQTLLRMPPADAARIILRAVQRRRGRVVVGRDAQALDLLARLLPVGYTRVLAAGTHLTRLRGGRRRS